MFNTHRFDLMADKAAATATTKSQNRFLKFLPKSAADKEKRSTKSIIPADALRSRSRNSSFGALEPTSPQVSCMGQLKHKKKVCSMMNNKTYVLPPLDHLNLMVHTHNKSKMVQPDHLEGDVKKKKKPLAIKNMFSRVPSVRRKSDHAITTTDYVGNHRLSSSCSLRRFSSSRTSLNNFDWTATQVAPVHNEEEKVKISKCVPKALQECKQVNFEPRKDVNLWKRRPMAQPSPLQLSKPN